MHDINSLTSSSVNTLQSREDLIGGSQLLNQLEQKLDNYYSLHDIQDSQQVGGAAGAAEGSQTLAQQDVANAVYSMSGIPQAGMCQNSVC